MIRPFLYAGLVASILAGSNAAAKEIPIVITSTPDKGTVLDSGLASKSREIAKHLWMNPRGVGGLPGGATDPNGEYFSPKHSDVSAYQVVVTDGYRYTITHRHPNPNSELRAGPSSLEIYARVDGTHGENTKEHFMDFGLDGRVEPEGQAAFERHLDRILKFYRQLTK